MQVILVAVSDEFHCTQLTNTGGSCLSRTAVKPDSRLARIFVAKFLCIIKLITVYYNVCTVLYTIHCM